MCVYVQTVMSGKYRLVKSLKPNWLTLNHSYTEIITEKVESVPNRFHPLQNDSQLYLFKAHVEIHAPLLSLLIKTKICGVLVKVVARHHKEYCFKVLGVS